MYVCAVWGTCNRSCGAGVEVDADSAWDVASAFSLPVPSAGIGGCGLGFEDSGAGLSWGFRIGEGEVSSLDVVSLVPVESTRGVVEVMVLASSPSRGGAD
jgi:hypothetical protein